MTTVALIYGLCIEYGLASPVNKYAEFALSSVWRNSVGFICCYWYIGKEWKKRRHVRFLHLYFRLRWQYKENARQSLSFRSCEYSCICDTKWLKSPPCVWARVWFGFSPTVDQLTTGTASHSHNISCMRWWKKNSAATDSAHLIYMRRAIIRFNKVATQSR